MSSVTAKTYDLLFAARVASFHPIKDQSKLVMEFGEWLAAKSKDRNFLIYRVELVDDGKRYE